MKQWFCEALYPEYYQQSLSKSREIICKDSDFQRIEIFENSFFGKVLALDGILQTTERDEYFYHEMFVHVPLITYACATKSYPEKVLIIGGGDGGILREVLKYPSIKHAVMIELDEDVVKECSKHIPSLNNGAFLDPRAEVKFIDGIDYVKKCAQNNIVFDIILVDSTDPIGAAKPLFTEDFYQNCKLCLKDNGILVTQSGVPFFQQEEMQNVQRLLRNIFDVATFFIVPVPTYVGSFMVLSFASAIEPRSFTIQDYKQQFNNLKINNLKYYNPEIHFSAFLLPNYIKNSII